LVEIMTPGEPSRWTVSLHDAEDSSAVVEALDIPTALDLLKEVAASAPFELSELDALGFKQR